MFFISAVSAAVSFTPVRAETDSSCTYRNNYEVPESPLKDIPVYQQGETELCYAYTASQLSEYHLRRTGQWKGKDHLDPLWIAIAYKGSRSGGIRIFDNELGRGYIHTALRNMDEIGICDPNVFAKAMADFKDRVQMIDADFLFLFEDFWDRRAWKKNESFEDALTRLHNRSEEFRRISARARTRTVGQNAQPEVTHEIRRSVGTIPACFRGLSLRVESDLQMIYDLVHAVPEEYVKRRMKIKWLREHVFEACSGEKLMHPQFPKTKGLGLGWSSNGKLRKAIDGMLDRPDVQPVGVGYCSNILKEDDELAKKGGRRKILLPRVSRGLNDKNCSMHYSMIVGRRPGPKGCQYLVRNSWGRDFWTKRYECLCRKTDDPNAFENCSPSIAEPTTKRVVGCWIDEKPLLNSMFDVVVNEEGSGDPKAGP